MPKFGHGISRAFEEVIGGFVISVILISFVNTGIIDPSYLFLFSIINVIGISVLILAMPYWERHIF